MQRFRKKDEALYGPKVLGGSLLDVADRRESPAKLCKQYGYSLYQDKGKCAIHFFPSDMFEVPYPLTKAATPITPQDIPNVTDLKQLVNSVTHFYTGALFHLFDESTQYALALRVASLVKRSPGTVIFGRHQGLSGEGGFIDDHLGR